MKNRGTFTWLVNEIELTYPVQEWKHNGYHIWPILRIRLYMKLISQFENDRDSKTFKERNFSLANLYSEFKSLTHTALKYLSIFGPISTLYCGAPSHRVDYMARKFNRYFDPLMDKRANSCLLIERNTTSIKKYYKPERVLLLANIVRLLRIFSSKYRTRTTEVPYVKELNSILNERGYELEDFITDLNHYISNVDRYILVWQKILEKLEPKRIFELCYYTSSFFAMNIVAHKMGIPTIDMQHGPQGKDHLAYCSWESVPLEGYEALPEQFHTWDKSSARDINEWAEITKKHSAVCTGNPWIEGWKNGSFTTSNYQWPDNIMLYTLQPIGDVLEPYLLRTIQQTKDKFNWWLRIHPRQMGEMSDIKDKLSAYDLSDSVNIIDATNLPLPEIIFNTAVHLTRFSGCALEAFNLGTPTILLDKRGTDIFKDYMESPLMEVSLNKNADELIGKINKLQENVS